MADVAIKLTLSEAGEVKRVCEEILSMRWEILASADMRDEYRRRDNGEQEWAELERRSSLLDIAIRKMA